MDSLSPDGEAEAFSAAFHASIVANARIAAAVLLLAGVALFRFRHAVVRSLFERAALAGAYIGRIAREGAAVVRCDRSHAVFLLGLIAGGAWLRARWLNQPVNYDESFTYITYVSRPAVVGLSDYGYLNNHLLHTLLAHMSTMVFGNTPWALRLPAYVAGCALMPLTYAFARRTSDATGGVLAAALVATNPVLMEFSACARGYSLVVACFLVTALVACDLVERDDDGAWTCLAVVAAIGFFAVPVFVYPYGAVLLWIVVARWRNAQFGGRAIRSMAVGIAITAALVALCYVAPLGISGVPERWQYTSPSRSLGSFVASLAQTLPATWRDLTRGTPPLLIAVVAGGVFATLWDASRARLVLLIAATVAWCAAALMLQRIVAPARAWLFLLPLGFTASAAGWASVWGRLTRGRRVSVTVTSAMAPALAVALMVAAFAVQPATFDETNEPEEELMKRDSEPIALFLKEHLGPDDAVVAAFPLDYPIEYYVRRHHLPFSLLARPSARAARYIIVANDRIGQTVEKVLATASFDPQYLADVRPLRAFTYSTLYELRIAAPDGR